MRAVAHRVMTRSPSDVSGLVDLFERGLVRPEDVVAILGKTEGNGGRNDFTRELAVGSCARLFAAKLGLSEEAVHDRVVLSFSGGTEGVASPHLVVVAATGGPLTARRAKKRLAIGVGSTRAFAPEEIGRRAQVDETARVIRAIAERLRLDGPSDVHLVQMKGAIPEATFEAAEQARKSGKPLRNDMVFSRAASALGAAIATSEVDPNEVTDDAVGARWDLFSSVASVSAKPGLTRTEIMVFANSAYWEGDLVIEHDVMRDLLDTEAVRSALARAGITFPVRPSPDQVERIVSVFAKAEADPRGHVRGMRHTMLGDDDIDDTRHARAALGAVLASVIGHTAVYVSTRAEHHGPLGGGPVAVLVRAGE